jgi:redox-sensitive bicupin YhaK (pirin superfamily)
MIQFSPVFTPSLMRHGDAFSARQYPRQAFGDLIDPVLNIDWFEMGGPTFPPHPHAGFSAVTYVFADSPNGFVNYDSLGTVEDIKPGGLHWTRASRGIMHEENPVEGAGPARGLQIFVNLPAANQADPAAAFLVPAGKVTTHSGDGWQSRVACDGTTLGDAADALPSPVRVEEIALGPGANRMVDVPEGWGGILIALKGGFMAGETGLAETQAIGFAAVSDGSFTVAASEDRARIAIIAGAQLKQPIFAHGPLMLASREALDRAFDYVRTLSIPGRTG